MFTEADRRPQTATEPAPIETVSFDVFDTMLLRRCTTPNGVFEMACRLAGCDTSRPGLVESFTQHRSLAEAKARKTMFKKTGRKEVPIEQIYERFPRQLFGLGNVSADALAEAEFQAELSLCVANPEILPFYRAARAAGKRTGFVSDTYWNGQQLAQLLTTVIPDLAWDFLYASCDHGSSKGEGLFDNVVSGEGLITRRMLHVGDNLAADIEAPQRLGISTHHHRQASTYFAGVLHRESSTYALLSPSVAFGQRLDGGLRSLRRCIANRLTPQADAFALGATVLGPIMAAFDRFISDEVEKLSVGGKQVAVAFLARDGYLPYKIWEARKRPKVGYAEINRRAAALAAVDDDQGFTPFFSGIEKIDHAAIVEMLGTDSPDLREFFKALPNGMVEGDALLKELPALLGRERVEKLARSMRCGLLEHMQKSIPGFDAATDLVLVDLGYRGSVQKGLRRALDSAGVKKRLHGIYLLTKDEALEVEEDDTAKGFIDDLTVSPQTKLTMLNNISVIEQLCSAQTGSVRGYSQGNPIREPDVRAIEQVEISRQAQEGAIHFAESLDEFAASGLDPFSDTNKSSAWAATLLARLVLMPTDDELMLLGDAWHDINLGTKASVPLIDRDKAADWMTAWSFSAATDMPAPPLWPAGSLSAVAPTHGFSYLMKGSGLLPREVFTDVPCGRVDVTLVDKTAAKLAKVICKRSVNNDLRVSVVLFRQKNIEAVAFPIGEIAQRGLLRGVTLQQHSSLLFDQTAPAPKRITTDRLHAVGIRIEGDVFTAEPDGKLVVMLPPLTAYYAIVTLLLSPFADARPMSLAADNPDQAPQSLPSLN